MSIHYQCKNNNCNHPGTTRFEMEFNSESILDYNNLAAAFCPFCKEEIIPSFLMDIPQNLSENSVNERI